MTFEKDEIIPTEICTITTMLLFYNAAPGPAKRRSAHPVPPNQSVFFHLNPETWNFCVGVKINFLTISMF